VPVTGRFGKPAMVLLLCLLIGFFSAGGVWVYITVRVTEERLVAQALDEYKQGKYPSAADKYRQLQERYPQSERLAEYQVLDALAGLRGRMEDLDIPPAEVIDQVEEFLAKHKASATFKPYSRDLGQSLAKRMDTFSRQVPGNDPNAEDVVRHAKAVSDEVSRFPDALTAAETQKIAQELAKVREAVALWRKHEQFLKQLQELVAQGGLDALRKARQVIRDALEQRLLDFDKEDAVQQYIQEIKEGQLRAVVYHEGKLGAVPPRKAPGIEDTLPSLVVTPFLRGRQLARAEERTIVLALARGVLYGLYRDNGEKAWAVRVGVDTTTLPVRLRRDAANPERILVLSADAGTLTALNDKCEPVWEYPLGSPCLGRPVIVEQRAFLATYDGIIHEIELIGGQQLGRYELGKPGHRPRLTVGGTRQENTNLIWFPADDTCVYVLDVAEKKCKTILYTNHPSGSLRGEPLVVPAERAGDPAYLILNQTAGLDDMQLRVYALPITSPEADPVETRRVRGWSWFPPYLDAEKVALVTDAGVLGLFGIKQARNLDPALFPRFLAGPGEQKLEPFLKLNGGGSAAPPHLGAGRGRAQMVHVQGEDYWVLAHGRMQRLRLGWQNDLGPRLMPAWKDPPALGSPLHASQVEEDLTGRSTLYVVTQALTQPECLATAIDDETGNLLWQRQLGLVCQGEPVPVRAPNPADAPLLLVMDQGGGLLAFDPARKKDRETAQRVEKADSFAENPRFPPVLLADDAGQGVWQVACPGQGTTLVLRRVGWAQEGERKLVLEWEKRLQLSAVPAGPPARGGDRLLLPLDNGILVRVTLADDKNQAAEEGPNWRLRRLGPEARGYVLDLGEGRCLTTNGADGVTCWDWAAGQAFQALPRRNALPKGELPPTLRLKDLVAAPPLLVPSAAQKAPRVCLADASGRLILFELLASGALREVRSWDLKGRVTAGPSLRTLKDGEIRLGCVMDGGRLVWLDPEQAEPLWQYGTPDDILVGLPQLLGEVLVLAYQSGRFVVLDPGKGKARGPGYTLRGNIASVVSPAAFGPGQAFAPLSDGTVLLLPLDR